MNRFLSSLLSLACLCAFFTLLASSLAFAQGPPIPPTVEIQGPPEPFNWSNGTPKLIAGTKFPWITRTGGSVQLGQRFKVYNAANQNGITITANGKTCAIDLFTPDLAHWSYTNANDPISVGTGAGTFTLTVVYKYNGVVMKKHNSTDDASDTSTYWVYKVEKDKDLERLDFVTSSIEFHYGNSFGDGGVGAPTGTPFPEATDDCTRYVRDNFKVTAPAVANNAFQGITVGIIQTATEATTISTVAYTANGPNGEIHATQHFKKLQPLPWWDGEDIAFACFYSVAAQVACGLGAGNTFTGGPVVLEDTPVLLLPMLTKAYQGTNYDFFWGSSLNPFANRLLTLSPPAMHWDFEVMLSAQSNGCPGVVVPINGYKVWTVSFDGQVDSTQTLWIGGTLVAGAATSLNKKPVSDVVRGPANTVNVADTFTFP